MNTAPTSLKPLFPRVELPHAPLKCPQTSRSSSKLVCRFWFYVHEYLLVPLSMWYMRRHGILPESAIYLLPFGLILKRHERVHEQEGHAMDLARAMGLAAPKFISYGSIDSKWHFPSLLMTRLPGRPLDSIDPEQVDYDILKADLVKILTRMRSFASPWGKRVCGVSGGPVRGPLMPAAPLPACADEVAFQEYIRWVTGFAGRTGGDAERVVKGKFFALPEHATVFTHGDLNNHNILVGDDGHICGIVDWEAAAWLPDYWEISVTTIMPQRHWGRFMDKDVSGGVYEKEIEGHRAIFPFISDTLSY
ncbi:hypothetical protein NLJ89_g855 [Agrocybe chaxingu]|uniref:Aminoglycoside phosphotransferase domain-containing protein n=1 Tax=Agrocybe chaxingu TaxID=84603 RepID=A0A9W8TG12_9AGAR|nr:hypothetical protein NLJ89_g855 [Agrocybe chaxingu]